MPAGAGSTTRYCFGDDASQLGDYAWHNENAKRENIPVGQKKPNAWGLFDMHGWVKEWCADLYGPYTTSPVDDPTGPSLGWGRVARGGDCLFIDGRSARRIGLTRTMNISENGLRVAFLPAEEQEVPVNSLVCSRHHGIPPVLGIPAGRLACGGHPNVAVTNVASLRTRPYANGLRRFAKLRLSRIALSLSTAIGAHTSSKESPPASQSCHPSSSIWHL